MSRRYGYVTHLNEIFQKVLQSCKWLSMNCRARIQSCRWVVESCTQNQALAQVLMRWPATKPVTARPSRVCWSGTSANRSASKIKYYLRESPQKGVVPFFAFEHQAVNNFPFRKEIVPRTLWKFKLFQASYGTLRDSTFRRNTDWA